MSGPQDKQILASELFDPEWYLSQYRDVASTGLSPAAHYLAVGAHMGRNPSPLFDSDAYLRNHPDVARVRMNPLLHYVRHGKQEGRIASRAMDARGQRYGAEFLARLSATPAGGAPPRFYKEFDHALERKFLAWMDALYELNKDEVDACRVSIIMPSYDRAGTISRAIDSVLAQGHVNWELIVVDDGSTDGTAQVVQGYSRDARLKVLRQDHRGVSAARNMGLVAATGDYIFYLDSDNRWKDCFVRNMLTYMLQTHSSCAYSGMVVQNESGEIAGVRGAAFGWEHCLSDNYVDLNCFAHKRSVYLRLGGFDERLRRMVDWDLILRYTRNNRPAYAPFVGCLYFDGRSDTGRISVSQPYAYRAVVQAKNRLGLGNEEPLREHLKLRFVIKIPAPFENRQEWGDFHYAESLKSALEKSGHRARVEFLGHWYDRDVYDDDVVIVLRGLTSYEPRNGQINILWNISHPDQVSYDEYEKYDIVYVASLSYPTLLNTIIDVESRSLLQCTDTSRFFDGGRSRADSMSGLLFVGNSRDRYRPMVRWAMESQLDLRIYGARWEQFLADGSVKGQNIDNASLREYYGSAVAVLNDHWDSMREFGFISNRIFDVVASNGKVISDSLPSIEVIFGRTVEQVESAEDLAATVNRICEGPLDTEVRKGAAEMIAENHSFDRRAADICRDVISFLGLSGEKLDPELDSSALSPWVGRATRPKVGLLPQRSTTAIARSGYVRLLSPLTTDYSVARCDVVVLDGVDDPRLLECDSCIVQRSAVDSMEATARLLDRIAGSGVRLFMDSDESLGRTAGSRPENTDLAQDAAMGELMRRAEHVWCSTSELMDEYSRFVRGASVVENTLDPRLWRDYRRPEREFMAAGILSAVYIGNDAHDDNFLRLASDLDSLHDELDGNFTLTLIGADGRAPMRPWLRVMNPPAGAMPYPRFVRWLSGVANFDIGIVPLRDRLIVCSQSDIELLEYSAMGVLPVISEGQVCEGGAKALPDRSGTAAWRSAFVSVVDNREAYGAFRRDGPNYVWSSRTSRIAAEQMVPFFA